MITLFAPECGECVHCRSPRTNRCVAIRDRQSVGYLPDGTTRFARDGEPLRHFMGTSTFAEYTVMPEIALAKVSPEAPPRAARRSPAGSRPGSARRSTPRRSRPDRPCAVFGCGLVGLGAVIGCRLAGADRIVALDLSEERLAEARRHGATDTRLAARRRGRLDPRRDRRLRRRLHLRGDRQRARHAAGGRGGAGGVGPRDDDRRRRQGRDARRPAAPADHRPARHRLARSAASRAGPRCRELVDRWLAGEIDADALVTHRITLDEVNDAFERWSARTASAP